MGYFWLPHSPLYGGLLDQGLLLQVRPDVNCGWCAVTKTCMEGVIMGPLSSNCSAWDYAFCSGEPCATYRTCSTCMSDPFCGWCPSTQLCSEGNKNGPLFGKCGDWEHGAMQSGCNSDGPPQAEADGPPTGADSSAEAPAGGLKNDATLSNAAPIDASPKDAAASK